MNELPGYNKCTYTALISTLKKSLESTKLNALQLAQKSGKKSMTSVKNAVNEKQQIVSDEFLSRFSNCLHVDLLIVYQKGKRYYFLKAEIIAQPCQN